MSVMETQKPNLVQQRKTSRKISEEQLMAKLPVLYKQHDTYYDACDTNK